MKTTSSPFGSFITAEDDRYQNIMLSSYESLIVFGFGVVHKKREA